MTMEQMNQKLEKILKELDNAIEDIDLTKVDAAITKAQKFNKTTEGKINEGILIKLNDRIKKIAEDIKIGDGLDVYDKIQLATIKGKIISGKDPFQKTKDVVDNLSKKGINQDDLKQYKETQKNDNIVQIEAMKVTNQELAVGIADIEMRYMEKIENNDVAIKIIKDIKKQKDLLVSLDPSTDAETISATKTNIKSKISELASRGVDVTSIQRFEANPSVIDVFETTKIGELESNSNNVALTIATDTSIAPKIIAQYELDSVSNAKELKDKYKEMVGTRQKTASKITTLEAENRQIEDTIKELDKEERLKTYAYNDDGSLKSESDIARAVLGNNTTKQKIEERISEKFDSRNPFKRFGARMDYYKETNSVGGFKAFWMAFASRTKTVKRIATKSEAARVGKGISDQAVMNMGKRQNDFKETIKREAAKKMSKDPTLTEKDMEDDIIKKAYESAFKDDGSR